MYYNGIEFDLPKKTMALNDRIESVNKATTTKDAYIRMFDLLIYALGDEKVVELLGSKNINDVDLIELQKIVDSILLEYDKALQENQLKYFEELANSSAVQNAIKIAEASKTVKKHK